ncbi:lipocalin-like domain-containing protein [Pseudomonas sp. Pseusp122]|uniref:lipocalin-like domain-containing protein n=1 Tax=unclassified Pseudomonas TaxID=196821 RepID=UPI0039A5D4E6
MKINRALLCIALLLSGCDDKTEPDQGFAGLGNQAADFAQVVPGKVLAFPADHGPHPDFRIEWWYITANLKDAQGNDFGVQWTLFRNALRPGPQASGWADSTLWMGHAAVTSATRHYAAERYARGSVGQAGVSLGPFSARVDDWALEGQNDLSNLQLQAKDPRFSYRLQLTSGKAPVPQGQQGFSQKSEQGQASYYYSQPFFQAQGQLEIDGKTYQVSGPAWLDREWSSQPLTANQTGWDWFSLHLNDGSEVMLYRMRQKQGEPYVTGTWINPDGSTQQLTAEAVSLKPENETRVAGHRLPTRWTVSIPGKAVAISVEALNANAWMNLSLPYWEGPVRLTGSHQGMGYLEMTGY